MFLPLKSSDKRQISSDDVAQYKLKLLQELHASYEKLNSHKIKERDEDKSYYDRSHKDVSFAVGEQVMLFTPQTEIGLSQKFLSRWTGPFKITAQLNDP